MAMTSSNFHFSACCQALSDRLARSIANSNQSSEPQELGLSQSQPCVWLEIRQLIRTGHDPWTHVIELDEKPLLRDAILMQSRHGYRPIMMNHELQNAKTPWNEIGEFHKESIVVYSSSCVRPKIRNVTIQKQRFAILHRAISHG